MKEYKRKRLAEYWCTDEKPKDIKKQLNSSERWRGKRQAEKEWNEFYNVNVQELRWNMEIEQSDACYIDEVLGYAAMLSDTLERLGLGSFSLHRCTCEKLDDLSDEEILKRNGYT